MKVTLKGSYPGAKEKRVTLYKSQYDNNGSLRLEGGGYILSTNIIPASNSLLPDQCFFKTWTENEGLLEQLEKQGAVKRLGISFPTGFVEAPLVKVLF